MTPHTWRLNLHTTGYGPWTYTLSHHVWEGPIRRSTGIEIMSTCMPSELHEVLDEVADFVLHQPGWGQDPLPGD